MNSNWSKRVKSLPDEKLYQGLGLSYKPIKSRKNDNISIDTKEEHGMMFESNKLRENVTTV